MDKARRDPSNRPGYRSPQAALADFFEQSAQLQFGHPRTDAAVDAVPERQVPPGIVAINDHPISILEHGLIAVGRDVP